MSGTLTSILTIFLALPCHLLAEVAARTAINRVTVTNARVLKRRKRFSELMRIPGNLVLRLRNAPVRVLSCEKWYQREVKLFNASKESDGLVIEFLDGVPLSELLSESESAEDKLAAILTGIESLFDFHVRFDQSHGDASVANVMMWERQDGSLSATWFDFDVAHFESIPLLERRVDDLRAILFTAKTWLTNQEFIDLFARCGEAYSDAEVLAELIKTMRNPLQHCDVFHLAQLKRTKRIPKQ